MAAEQTGKALEKYLERPDPSIEPREASSERSPNRMPRYREVMKLAETEHAKKAFLRIYNLTGRPSVACEHVDRSASVVAGWIDRDEAFSAAYLEVKQKWIDINGEHMVALTRDALDAIDRAINQTEDPRLSMMAAKEHLRGTGVYSERQKKEISGPGGGPIHVRGVVYDRVTRSD